MEKINISNLLPLALGIIMFGLGLSLTVEDFLRVKKYPRAVTIALVCQMILLPLICFLLVTIADLSPAISVGFMLLAASPGGATANLYSHLSNGDVALNITLTALNSVLSLFALPLIVNFSLNHFMDSDQFVPMQFAKVIEVFIIVLGPVLLGMLIRSRLPAFAAKMDKPVKAISVIFLVLIIFSLIIRDRVIIVESFGQMGLPIIIFNIVSLLIGFFIPLAAKIERRQAIAIGLEIGIHNGTLAIFLAVNVIANEAMSLPAAIYSLVMFITAAIFGYLVSGRKILSPQQ